MKEEQPTSPIVEGAKVELVSNISATHLIKVYQENFNCDISYLLQGVDQVKKYRCLSSGYEFFCPFKIAGDARFYENLSHTDSYYRTWKWEYDAALKFITGSRVLEVGCGSGEFLKGIKKYKPEVEVIGLELNSEQARAHDFILNTPLEEYCKDHVEAFDVVCSFQVVEHVSDVYSFIKAQLECLKPGGKLMIVVPNNDSFLKWENLSALNLPPHHMGWWNKKSLVYLEKVFDIKVTDIVKEPLGKEYRMHYYDLLTRKVFGLRNGANFRRLMRKLKLQNLCLSLIGLFSFAIQGHSIIAVYQKK